MSEFNSVEIVNTKVLTDDELAKYAKERFELVNSKDTKWHLRQRFLGGFIARSSSQDASYSTMADSRLDPINQTYIVVDSHSNGLIGMGSLMPGLKLHKQSIPGPTRILRKLAEYGQPNSCLVDQMGPSDHNVSAWVRPSTYLREVFELTSAFSYLKSLSALRAWTLLPTNPALLSVETALLCSQYERICQAERYDDYSATRPVMDWAPISELYVALGSDELNA